MGRFGIGGNAYADFFLYHTHPCHPRVGGDLLLKRAAPRHCEGRIVPKQSIQVDYALKKCIYWKKRERRRVRKVHVEAVVDSIECGLPVCVLWG